MPKTAGSYHFPFRRIRLVVIAMTILQKIHVPTILLCPSLTSLLLFLGPYIFNTVAFCLFQIRQRLSPFFRQLAARKRNFLKATKSMKKPQKRRSSSKSTEALVESCAFILLLLMASETVSGSIVEVPLDHLYHFNPCTFNPMCVCSTGGRFYYFFSPIADIIS